MCGRMEVYIHTFLTSTPDCQLHVLTALYLTKEPSVRSEQETGYRTGVGAEKTYTGTGTPTPLLSSPQPVLYTE
jgi:hypothetical protein